MFVRPLLGLVACVVPGVAFAQPAAGPRVVAARATCPAATFSARPANGNVFTTVPENGELYTGDLIVSLPGGTLVSKNGAVAVKALADFDGRSPLPILETAFSLADPAGADLDITLDRGRVDISNVKAEGAATVRVRFWDQVWKVELDSPNTRVSVELCGRWPPGTRFRPAADPARAPAPVASLVFVVLAGSASVDLGGVTFAVKAPPGPAELRWNSLTGTLPQPQKLEKLPDWADPAAGLSGDGQKAAAASEKFRAARAADPVKALDAFLASGELPEQRAALVACGGFDDLERLGKALVAAKTLDEWDFGVTVLRHWLGRGPGQEQRLFRTLTTARGYTDAEARIILQLLFGFSPKDLAAPETYEVLIDYLLHEKPAVRNLAMWHLVRLAPQGKAIPYKPDGTAADAQKAHAEWKKLIPRGQVPAPAKGK
jgi:hypothetical protein